MSIEPVTGTHQEGGSTNVPPSVNAAEPVPTQPRSSWRLLKVLVALVILSPLAIGTYVLWPSGDALARSIHGSATERREVQRPCGIREFARNSVCRKAGLRLPAQNSVFMDVSLRSGHLS